MQSMEKSWEQRLEEARREWEKSVNSAASGSHRDIEHPYLQNVNEDPQLSGVVRHPIQQGEAETGSKGPA